MSHFVINSIPFHTRISQGPKSILVRDRARAQKLLAGLHAHGPVAFRAKVRHDSLLAPPPTEYSTASQDSIDVTDAGVTYTIPVKVGQPPTTYTLLIDTGNSNTWIGASKDYKPTSTSTDTRRIVNVTYGSGTFTGIEYIDQLTLGGNLVVKQQSIGVASSAQGFDGVDGILGIGPVDLTTSTVENVPSVPTVIDNLFTSGIIPTESIGISYVPTDSMANVPNGELTFGATDTSKFIYILRTDLQNHLLIGVGDRFIGSINYVPITDKSPAKNYWGIDQTLTYGRNVSLLEMNAGIVDTGTTLLHIASDAFNIYQQATGAAVDSSTGLLTVTEQQFANMESMFFNIGSVTYEFTSNAQIWPRAQNSAIGGEPDKIYLVVADLGSSSGLGLDFINGFVFLQRFYSVYDRTNGRVGLANTQFTQAGTN